MTIEIFTASRCGYCDRAKALLDDRGFAYADLDISADPAQLEAFRRRLPQIFVGGEHIGGYEDLCLLDSSGKLADIVAADDKQ